MNALSANAQAILLLTAPLLVGRGKRTEGLLTVREYSKLARHLRDMGSQPADLLAADVAPLLGECHQVIDEKRLQGLLGRGFLLSLAVEHWRARAIWVMSRADDEYPKRLKARLKGDAPPLLYGCGPWELPSAGGLAVVGSRNVEDGLVEYTRSIGRLAATAGRTLVSGGARGVDEAAMRGALDAGGRVTGVLPDNLERKALHRGNRDPLLKGQLVLMSPFDPGSRFNVGHAMQRNKVIYALADAALVVESDLNKGGTWAGATEQLDKLRLTRIYVRSTGEPSEGLAALKERGALPWPNPGDADGLASALNADSPKTPSPEEQQEIPFHPESVKGLDPSTADVTPERPPQGERCPSPTDEESARGPGDVLFEAARTAILRVAREPRKGIEIADELAVNRRQAEEWLKRLVDEGMLEKRTRPVRYVAREAGLFTAGDSP